jgi:2-dehydro-3-deoxygluconokinase
VTAREQMSRFLALTDIAFPSRDDEVALFGNARTEDILDRYEQAGLRQGALKCGGDGAIALDGSRVHRPASPTISVVDTTAAGDSFNAGFLAALDQGKDVPICLAEATALAERVVCAHGAILPKV